MSTSFLDLMDETEIANVPSEGRPFLASTEHQGDRQTWAYFAYGYEAAFYALLDEARAARPRRDYLHVPIVHLCRHSIELWLKHAILFISRLTGSPAKTGGHNLTILWRELEKQVVAAGFPTDDDWSNYCKKLIDIFQNSDLRADRFRYPSDLTGNPYPPDEVDLDIVGKTHWHVVGYCEAVVSMIEASSPY